jgi:hypothetical protein
MSYFYVQKVAQADITDIGNYTASGLVANGDYFLLTQQDPSTENGIYRRLNNTATKINPQPQPAGPTSTIQSITVTSSGGVYLATAVYAGSTNFPINSQINIANITSPTGFNGRWTVEINQTASVTSSVSWYSPIAGTASGTASSTVQSNADLIISIQDNQEWTFATTTRSLASTTLSAGSAIRLATQAYFTGATNPVPLGISSFPEQIDVLKILDFSTEADGKEKLVAYYTAFTNYYADPSAANLALLNTAAFDAKAYILTDEDYNALAQSVMNTQLYLKQYLPQIAAVTEAQVESFVNNADQYYIQDANAYAVYESTSTPSAVTIGGISKNYIWFDTTQ